MVIGDLGISYSSSHGFIRTSCSGCFIDLDWTFAKPLMDIADNLESKRIVPVTTDITVLPAFAGRPRHRDSGFF